MSQAVRRAGVAFLLAISVWTASEAAPPNQFIVVNGVKPHLDWGGVGDAVLFLPSFGASVHEFDDLVQQLTDTFHVLGLTRRGQAQSDAPVSGYDTPSLVEDIRGFLDAKHIGRVTLVGYSIAGPEEMLFASTYPDRINKLVYLDATGDPKSGYELATNPATPIRSELRSPRALSDKSLEAHAKPTRTTRKFLHRR